MELHTLQDALKHEIQQHQKLVAQIKQDPQDVELKKQLHERQARITALSEKQKKVVEQLRKDLVNKQHQRQHGTSGDLQPHATKMVSRPPVAIAIPLVKGASHNAQQQQPPPRPVAPIAPVVPVAPVALLAPVAPVAPVTPAAATSLSNGQKTPPRIETSAQTPGVHAAPHRSKQVFHGSMHDDCFEKLLSRDSRIDGSLSSPRDVSPHTLEASSGAVYPQVGTSQVPLRIPQFPAVQRLVGKSLAILPEIRPKPLASTPSIPAQDRQHCNGKTAGGAHARALHAHVANGTAGTTIKSGSSVDEAKPMPTRMQVAPGRARVDGTSNHGPSPHHSMSSHGRSPPHGMVNLARSRMSDSAEKVAFMVALGLATPEHVEELQSRRQERKRRTTANPLYSGAYYEPECKRGAASYLSSSAHHATRRRVPDDPTWRAEAEECCCVCKRSGLLLTCDACSGLYHLECLEPPLKSTPRGVWFCQECQQQGFKKDDAMLWPETLAVVHAYIAQKTTKEEERRRLLKRSAELRCQCEATEGRVSTVGMLITKSVETRGELVAKEDQSRASLERLRTLLALVQDSRSPTATCPTTLVSL